MAEPGTRTSFLLTGCEVILPDRVIRNGAVLAEDGRIQFAGSADRLPARLPDDVRRIAAPGLRAAPALWETHIHGCGGVSTESMTAESLTAMAAFLARKGIGAFMPTIVPDERTIECLGAAIQAVRSDPAVRGRVLGVHAEGPFVSPARRGAIPADLLREPSVEYLDRMIALSRKTLRILTIAPELPGARAVIDRLRAAGILPSLGHSDAAYAALLDYDTMAPLNVTHLFNAMSGVSHRDPGLAHWALLNTAAYTELNADGTHVHDAAVRLALRSRPLDRIIAISDAVAPAGLPPDHEVGSLYGRNLTSRGSGLFYADTGVLVGSRFLITDVIARLVAEFRVPVADAVAMAALSPARLLGYEHKGALLPGYDADVALFNRDFSRCSFLSWEGTTVFESPTGTR